MHGCRKRKLLKDVADLGKISNQFFNNRLRGLAVRTFQITELYHHNGRGLRAYRRTISSLERCPDGSIGIGAKRKHLADHGILTGWIPINMDRILFVE